ncbi:MAG: sugar phosphate isomerase/epimerase [Candidatus Poribacteria bacterium]|nr:sugar phosphate isomerase/epimerase [Candidatus Poribacteria bacterium]
MSERIPIALQLYSVRDDCAKDLSLTLQAVAQMGYDGVEFAGYYDRTAEELRGMCDDLELKVVGTHTGLNTLLGDQLAKTVEFNKILGNPYLIVPGLGAEYTNSQQAWKNTAKLFNEIADKISDQGMYTGYHNHTGEFKSLEGEVPWDTFASNTHNDVVLQIDTGHVLRAGADNVPFIERYPGRYKLVHIKEYSATNDKAVIGEGDMPWDDVFEAFETVGGTEWYIVEQESYAFPPIECAEKCIENLRKMGKI